jgi:hypothetical protein
VHGTKEFSMKKNLKIFGIIVLLAVIGLSMTGCPEDTFTWKFVNKASKTVNVSCYDLNPSSFSISPGESKTATSSLAVIGIIVTPGDTFDSVEKNYTFTFTDKVTP